MSDPNKPLAWVMQGPPAPFTQLNGRQFLYFAGTGYLGLQAHPEVLAAAAAAAQQWGVHSATTRTGYGTSPPVQEVETRAAQLLGTETACYLVSGYAGNFSLAAAISDQVTLAFIDESAHDCLRESTRWLDRLRLPAIVFRHRDANHLAELMAKHVQPGDHSIVMTDGVFPISGQLAPLTDYLEILGRYKGSMLLVDDAHGLAVLGNNGRGSLELAGIPPERINRGVDIASNGMAATDGRPLVFHSTTLSKAVGGHGGVIAGSSEFLDRVKRSSGWFRGASAPAAPVAAATAKGLEIIAAQPELRQQLAANILALRTGIRSLGLDVELLPTPIIGLKIGTSQTMAGIQQRLADEGIAIAYTRDYAGVGPEGLLRIAVFATHTSDMIGRLVEALGRVL